MDATIEQDNSDERKKMMATATRSRSAYMKARLRYTETAGLPLFLDVVDIHKVTGISMYTVREMLRRGDITGMRLGNRWRVRKVDFEEWLESQVHQPCERQVSNAPRTRHNLPPLPAPGAGPMF